MRSAFSDLSVLAGVAIRPLSTLAFLDEMQAAPKNTAPLKFFQNTPLLLRGRFWGYPQPRVRDILLEKWTRSISIR